MDNFRIENLKIAVLPGDGICQEVIEESIRVLEALQDKFDAISLELTRLDSEK